LYESTTRYKKSTDLDRETHISDTTIDTIRIYNDITTNERNRLYAA